MKKSNTLEKKSKKREQKSELKKSRNLFDHLNSIRTTKQPDYYESLTEQEKKGFNHWAILYGLSQDINLVELVSFLWRDGYYDKIPSSQFYKLLVDLVPQTNQRLFWAKKSRKTNQSLLKYISSWYSISTREANEYLTLFMSSDDGIKELGWILEGLGLNENEAEKVLSGENEDE